ncbi:MAG: hypothetical protein AB8H80_04240 [Planctomycetota bacterium]
MPSFANDGFALQEISGYGEPNSGTLTVAVLGLAQLPMLLPGTPDCLLLPRPDVVVPLGPQGVYQQPIPAAVRPITVHVQAVQMLQSSFVTASAFRVDTF